MRNDKLLLKLVKKELLNQKYLKFFNEKRLLDDKVYLGICHVVASLRIANRINKDERYRLIWLIEAQANFIQETSKLDKPFWNLYGKESLKLRGVYLWKPRVLQPRLDWLNEEIGKL